MRVLVSMFLVLQFCGVAALAATYSCRDNEGRLYITDNLQALPEECRAKAEAMSKDDPDNLNYVPVQETPAGVGAEAQRQIEEVEQRIKQKRVLVDSYLSRSEVLAGQYEQAVKDIRKARRNWSYQSRDKIRAAEEKIEQVRIGKKKLLGEMGSQRLDPDKERQIMTTLDRIADQ